MTVWLSAEAIAAWTPRRSGRRGGQRRYSDLAIETALTLRLLYHLPLRQAEGFLHALFGMMRLDLSAPRLYDALPAQSASDAPSATGPDRRGASIWCLTAQVCPSSGQVSGRPRNTVAAAGVAGGNFTLASISQA